MTDAIKVHPEVRHALEAGRAVVALETAVTTTGLPRHPLDGAPPGEAPGWDRPGDVLVANPIPPDAALEASEAAVAAAEDLAATRGITGRQFTLPALALKAGGPNVDKARAEILTTQGLAALLILV